MSPEAHNDFSDRQRRGPFLCECGNSLCPERVWLGRHEYERIVTRVGLVLALGHEDHPSDHQAPLGPSRKARLSTLE